MSISSLRKNWQYASYCLRMLLTQRNTGYKTGTGDIDDNTIYLLTQRNTDDYTCSKTGAGVVFELLTFNSQNEPLTFLNMYPIKNHFIYTGLNCLSILFVLSTLYHHTFLFPSIFPILLLIFHYVHRAKHITIVIKMNIIHDLHIETVNYTTLPQCVG